MFRFIFFFSLLMTACSTSDTSGIASPDSTKITTGDGYIATSSVPLEGCYTYNLARDTATMKLTVTGDSVTGILKYRLYEKDSNSGTIKGVKKDSLLVADYTFQSEGMKSVREVVFKITDLALVEGFGAIYTSGDTVRFKNKDGLQFENSHVFKKINCN